MPALRPPADILSMKAAGAVVANALSFSRLAMRDFARGRWRIEKLRFDLDAEGRGEVLYRLVGGGWTFHFFLVALKLEEADKMDRNWAQSWDAMGALCQGEWTPEREALLREEIPKQRGGYADYGTLVYARGNRSARFFDHVVERLAAGEQPDIALLARVGYLLRTTAFICNGQLGTRAFAGLEPGHPLGRPYDIQMASGFVLREYVFDLADHVARARNPKAARLDPAYRRFLGLGNAAATGLISYVVNHPQQLERWTRIREEAYARAAAQPPDAAARVNFVRLLERAIRYHRESVDERTDLFATAGLVADELARLQAAFAQGPAQWGEMLAWAETNLAAEAAEVARALVLEIYPALSEAAPDAFTADERMETAPGMTLGALRDTVQSAYGWALGKDFGEATERYFWYRAANTPRENRRGLRTVAPEFQSENGMDTARQVGRLWRRLAHADPKARVAELLCTDPELRHIVARVQSLAGSPYAELRVNWLAPDFSPFEPVRWILSYFGMEKFEAARPKSVRGAFLQGAPIAEDVARGRDGDWPWPVIPAIGSHAVELAPLPPAGLDAVKALPKVPVRAELRIAPAELARTVHTALHAAGAPWGVAEEAGALVAFAHALGEPALEAALAQFRAGLAPNGAAARPTRDGDLWRLDANGASALVAAPAALDLACAVSPSAVLVENTSGAAMLAQLAFRCAERGHFGLALWRGGFAAAGPGRENPWLVAGTDHPGKGRIAALGALAVDLSARVAATGGFGLLCLNADVGAATAAPAWGGSEMRNRMLAWQREGLTITPAQYAALNAAAAALLVPVADVPRLRPGEDPDPLKVF